MERETILSGTLLICFMITVLICGGGMYLLIKLSEKLNDKKCTRILFCIAFAGFAVRLVYVLFVQCVPISDYNTMYQAAVNFAGGDNSAFKMGSYLQRFPHMTPFSVFCGFLMSIFGKDILVIKIFNCIFKFAAIIAMGFAGKELYGKKGMLTAAFMYAIFPIDIFYSNVLASENFAITFFVVSVIFYLKAYKSEGVKETIINALICGAVLSVGCLFRGVAPFYLAAYAGGAILLFVKIRRKILAIVSILAAYLVVLNAVSFGLYFSGITEYKLTDKGEPFTVYMLVGSNFETNGMYSKEDHDVYFEAGQNSDKASEIAIKRMLKRYSENPEKIIPHFIKKTEIVWVDSDFDAVYWSVDNNGVEGNNKYSYILENAGWAYNRFSIILLIVVLLISRKQKETFLLMLIPLVFAGGLCLIEIQPRYGYSAGYIFSMFSAIGMCGLYEYKKGECEMNKYLKLARPHHCIKNIFILMPLFFSMQLLNTGMFLTCFYGIVAFSLASSAIYIINDLHDVEKDRQHPKKKLRPIASGEISEGKAKIFMWILFTFSAFFAFLSCQGNGYGYMYLGVYIVLNIFYSFGGKNIPILDIAILASGFLIRLLFGATIIRVDISSWLYLTVIALSFYLGLGKRRNELSLGKETRDVLKYYSYEFLDKMMYMFMPVAIVFYSLWCVDPVTVSRFSGRPVIWTVPVVILICMRYSMIVEGDSYGDPVDVIVKDKILIALCAIYAVTMALMLYVRWI